MTAIATPSAAAPRSRRKPAPPVQDRATAYCHEVLAGRIIAGPHVRAACSRHLQDLQHGPARGLAWSLPNAQRAIAIADAIAELA